MSGGPRIDVAIHVDMSGAIKALNELTESFARFAGLLRYPPTRRIIASQRRRRHA